MTKPLAAVIVAPVILLTGCDGAKADQQAYERLRTAVGQAVCATDRRDLNIALGSVAVAAADIPEATREDTVWSLAGEVSPKVCAQVGKKPLR